MSRRSTTVRLATACLVILITAVALHATKRVVGTGPAAAPFVGVEFQIRDETVPPGGIV